MKRCVDGDACRDTDREKIVQDITTNTLLNLNANVDTDTNITCERTLKNCSTLPNRQNKSDAASRQVFLTLCDDKNGSFVDLDLHRNRRKENVRHNDKTGGHTDIDERAEQIDKQGERQMDRTK